MEKQHRGLKFLVIFMGVLIILGICVIAYTIISRIAAGGKDAALANATTEVAAPVQKQSSQIQSGKTQQAQIRNWKPRPLKAFGDVSAKIPLGAVIEEMTTDRQRLILRLRLVSGQQAVHVFNLQTGARLGRISLQTE